MATRFLKTHEGEIAYEEEGSGPVILCAPGLGDLRAQYRFLSPRLAAAGYRAVSMDLRGHGESSPNWQDASVAGVGSDMLELLDHLNAGPAVLIGNSMAAGAAIWAAAEAPQKVKALVLLGPAVRGDVSSMNALLFRLLFARPWGAGMWAKYYTSLYPTYKPADLSEYVNRLHASLERPGRIEFMLRMILSSKSASEARISKVHKPALVIMGSRDPDFKQPEEEARWVARGLNASYQIIADAGHYPHVEMPETTANSILAFLEKVEA